MVPIYIAPTKVCGNSNFDKASDTRHLIDSAALSVNVNATIESAGQPLATRYAILKASVLDFPDPAQAKHKMSR